jgi:uncharacterized membrane protein
MPIYLVNRSERCSNEDKVPILIGIVNRGHRDDCALVESDIREVILTLNANLAGTPKYLMYFARLRTNNHKMTAIGRAEVTGNRDGVVDRR